MRGIKKLGKVILWIVVIVAGLELCGIVLSYIMRRIPSHTVLEVRIEGEVPEQTSRDPLAQLTGTATTVTDIVEGLDRARDRKSVVRERV